MMSFTVSLPDIIIFGVIFIFGCKGLGYGFSRSLSSLVGTTLSLAGAIIFSVDLADFIVASLPRFPIPQLISYLVIFLGLISIFKTIFHNIFSYKRDNFVTTISRIFSFPIGLIEGIVFLYFFVGLLVFQDLFIVKGSFWVKSIIIQWNINSIPLFRTF